MKTKTITKGHKHEWHLRVSLYPLNNEVDPWDEIQLIPEAYCWYETKTENCDAILTYSEIEKILNGEMEPISESTETLA